MLLAAPAAFAQVTTASIRGTVVDAKGEGLPGVNVVALHVPTGTQYGTSTRVDGKYNLPNLRVGGPYTILTSYVGFETQKREGLSLTLGQVMDINFTLAENVAALSEVVITTNKVFNSDRTGAEESFNVAEISKLPTISRSASDIYRLTPSSDGNSFAGRSGQYNNFSLDGSIFNNPFGLDAATPGGQTDAQPVSLDAIAQIQVAVAPYDVTQSGFTGASVNAVTKSGSNKFTGSAFAFYRSDELTGNKVKGEEVFVPNLTQLQAGASLGGPIVKDKLFFFANFETDRRQDQGSSFVAGDGVIDEINESRVLESDLLAVQGALRSVGYEPGAYQGFRHDTENIKGIFKLDWNVNNNHTITATYNFLDAFKQKPAHPSAIGRRGPDATTLQFQNSGYQINNNIHSGLVEWRARFGNKYANKLQVGYTKFTDRRDPFSTPFPVININQNGIRYIVAGHEPFSINNTLDQDVIQITNNFDIYFGNHNVTVGASFERFDFNNSFNLNYYGGTFGPGFNSVNEFLNYAQSGQLKTDAEAAQATFEAADWQMAETNVGQFAAYVQDRYDLSDNLTVTAGLRVDVPLYFNTADKIQENIDRNCCYDPSIVYTDENGNDVQFDHTKLPKQTPLISPRIGFNWDVNGDQMLQIRGGSGLFTGRLPFVWIGNQVANPNSYFYNVTAPNFKFPQVWRTSLGADKRLGQGWTITTDLAYTKDANAMLVRNYGLDMPTGTLNVPGVGDTRSYYKNDDKVNNAYVFTNTDLGKSFNATLQVKREWANGLYTSLAYNYLDAKDASSIEAEISSDAFDRNPALGNVNLARLANSVYGNKHRVVGNANKTFKYGNGKWATTLSLYAEYSKGGRFSYTYAGDINNDGASSFGNDLIYVPTEAEINSMSFVQPQFTGDPTQAQQRAALNAFIAQDKYLSTRRGDYAERNAVLSPWYSRYDFRLLQDYNLSNGHVIQFSADILNIGNFINSDWGVREFPTNTQIIGANLDEATGNVTYSFDPNLTKTFTPSTGLASRWQMQFGLRYSF